MMKEARWLWFLILAYVMIVVMSNWFDARLVSLLGIVTDAGTLVFPLTFLLSDLITEVYGYKIARLAIWCGFLFNILFLLFGQLVSHLPSPPYANNNIHFDQVLMINLRIIIASILSYFTAEPLNAYLMATMKIKMRGHHLARRFVISCFFASGLDSFLFSLLAFYNTMPGQQLIMMIVTMWVIKVLVEILGLPLSVYLSKKLKHIEKRDIFDTNTAFTLFSLNHHYSPENNHYNNPH